MKIRSFLSYLILFVFSVGVVVGCNPATSIKTSTDTASPTATGDAAISLGYSAWPGWFPWQVAQEEGIFQANNASVELKWFDGYLESISALTAGQIDANSQTLNDTISSVSGGADLAIVLVNDNSTGNDKIIVSEEINSIADLKGKKIAAEEGTVDHYLLLLGLEKEGLSAEDIEFVPLETGQAATAFVGGQIDAVAVFAPFTTQALKRPGSKELFSSKDFPGAISDHLVFNRQLIEENPEQVQAVVDSWFATLDTIEQNQEQAMEIMAKRANVTVEEYQDYADGTTIFSVEDNLQAFEPGQDVTSLQFSAQKISDFLVQAGLAAQAPDLSNLFDDRFVKAYAEKIKVLK
ncbi:MAG: ABC transporter substrate-binding protein [Pleurocapsa sp.]